MSISEALYALVVFLFNLIIASDKLSNILLTICSVELLCDSSPWNTRGFAQNARDVGLGASLANNLFIATSSECIDSLTLSTYLECSMFTIKESRLSCAVCDEPCLMLLTV